MKLPPNLAARLYNLEAWIDLELDRILDELRAKLETMARSTGQRTRIRKKKE